MDYKPRPILSRSLNTTYKKKRIFWFNSDFNDAFTSNNNKITDITFNIPPFQLYNNNNMRVISYIRNDANVQPIVIKLKEPYCDNRLITNTDKEGNAIIYINHTGVEGMTSMSPNFLLIPQQIPRFVFRLDDNFNQLDSGFYFSSVTNGSFFQVAGGSPDDKYLLFNSSGSFALNQAISCDILVVGGGGSGGGRHGGGGGAGAVIYLTNQTLSGGSYSIVVGSGGAAVNIGGGTAQVPGNSGQDTTITFGATVVYKARGGGFGHWYQNSGGTGGSGGGSGGNYTTVINNVATDNIPSGAYGNIGGKGNLFTTAQSRYGGGGGGGAGTAGGDASQTDVPVIGGNGGNGRQIDITGTSIYYGGGGGGGIAIDGNRAGTGGLGGGGAGSKGSSTKATNGTANTGGGGGGSGFNGGDNSESGAGGSGVVIIRFKETRQEGITPVNNKPPSFILGLELEDIDMKKDNIVSIYR